MSAALAKMRIGEVHSLLREEFPTIELSKIRYYEEKGLVCPSRSRKGYRLYTDNDVTCLREAIRMAQQEFVPLRVVRQRLIEQGLLSDVPAAAVERRAANEPAVNVISMRAPSANGAPSAEPVRHLSEVPAAPSETPTSPDAVVAYFSAGAHFDEKEFLAATGLSAEELRELRYFGFISPREVAGRPIYADCDLIIAKRFGALGARGVEIRHLVPLKRVVERQIDLLNDLTSPLRQSRERNGTDASNEMRAVADEIAALRSALMTKGLQEYFGH